MKQRRPVLRTAFLLALTCINAIAAPTGGVIVSGTGGIATSGATTTVTQTSGQLSLNWATFNVGTAETVRFNQPSASSLAVNRIADINGSRIQGSLQANGQVYLINPNGIIFGSTAQVNVGGLVASTLDVADTNLANGTLRFAGAGKGTVANHGTINATFGGYVALLGGTVANTGTITASGGTVALGAGNRVALDFAGDRLVSFAVEENTVLSEAANGGLIRADGGQVLLSAGARNSLVASVVNNTGVIEARTLENRNGRIVLLGGMNSGTTTVAGTLDASAPNGGNGGFIETSAAHVKVANSARITTAATAGKTGTWLIDPQDFTIAASGGDISGATLATQLADSNVVIESVNGATTGNGDIFVNDTVSWSGNKLTLSAVRNIAINANLTGGVGASLDLLYGQGAIAAGNTANYSIASGKSVSLPSGTTLRTQLGSDGALNAYTVINTIDELQGASGVDYIALGADINGAVTATWNDNGDGAYAGFAPLDTLSGTFAGLGHTITGLTINRPNIYYVGLFSQLSGGTLRDVHLVDSQVTGGYYVGGLVGNNQYGTLSNVSVGGAVTGLTYVGGLVGYNSTSVVYNTTSGYDPGYFVTQTHDHTAFATISGSTNTASVTGAEYVGGVAGFDSAGLITGSVNKGVVSGANSIGGLVGGTGAQDVTNYAYSYDTNWNFLGYTTNELVRSEVTQIQGSRNEGSVTATVVNNSGDVYVGGLVGYNSRGAINDSVNTGAVRAEVTSNATGILYDYYAMYGWEGYTPFWQANASAKAAAGGLVGYNEYGTITGSTNSGAVVAEATGTGGAFHDDGFRNSVYLSAYAYAGGLVGSNKSGVISGSTNTGQVDAAAQSRTNTVEGYTYTSISSASEVYAGGLVGDHQAASTYNSSTNQYDYITSIVTGSLNAGSVTAVASGEGTATVYVGGLLGKTAYSDVSLSANTGAVTASVDNASAPASVSVYAGGLVGHSYLSNLSDSTNSGAVSAAAISNSAGNFYDYYAMYGWEGYTPFWQAESQAKSFVGGLVGYNERGIISGSENRGEITAAATATAGVFHDDEFANNVSANAYVYAGGLVGQNKLGEVSGSSNSVTGRVAATANAMPNPVEGYAYSSNSTSVEVQAGGLVGINEGGFVYNYATNQNDAVQASLTNGSNAGSVTVEISDLGSATVYAGGLVGKNYLASVDQGINTGAVTLTLSDVASTVVRAGGVIGSSEGASAYNYTTGQYDYTSSTVANVANSGSVLTEVTGGNATVYAGGILGESHYSNLSQASNTGGVTVAASGVASSTIYAGGLAGYNSPGLITAASNAGDIRTEVVGGEGTILIGGLVGHNEGATTYNYTTGQYESSPSVVSGSFNTGAVTAEASGTGTRIVHAGGLVGKGSYVVLNETSNAGLVTATNVSQAGEVYAGGLVGYNTHGTIVDSFNTGAISADMTINAVETLYDYYAMYGWEGYPAYWQTLGTAKAGAGGLAGYNEYGTISGFTNRGEVTALSTATGGSFHDDGIASYVSVNAYAYAGGLFGQNKFSTISKSMNAASGRIDASATATANPIEGYEYSSVSTSAEVYAGGLVGNNEGVSNYNYTTGQYEDTPSSLVDVSNAGSVTAASSESSSASLFVGGLVGKGYISSLNRATNSGAVDAVIDGVSSSFAYAGGLVGYGDSRINYAFNEGAVTVTSNNVGSTQIQVGGLVGYTTGNIGLSYNSGAVAASITEAGQATVYIGGLAGVGSNTAAAYNVGTVNVDLVNNGYVQVFAGGLAGYQASGYTVETAYNTGAVVVAGSGDGSVYAGGLLGYDEGSNFAGVFWDTTTSQQAFAVGSNQDQLPDAGLTTAQLQSTDFLANAQVAYLASGAHDVNALVDGWDASVWSPSSVGYYSQLYALTPVLVADGGSKGYGETTSQLGTITHGGTGSYVFGQPADFIAGDSIVTSAANTGVGSVVVNGTVTSDEGVVYRVIGTNLTITARAVELTANDQSRAYGDANPEFTYTVNAGSLVEGDSLALTTDASVTSNVGAYGITLADGAVNANYAITFTDGTLTVNQRAIELTANDQIRVYGDANPDLSYTVNSGSLVEGESLSLTTDAGVTSNVGSYGIGLVDAAVNANYAITFTDGTLNVTQREISVTADDQTKVSGNANPALTYTLTNGNLVNDDAFTGALTTSATLTSGAGSYAITQGSLALSTNYALSVTAGQMTVTPKPVSPSVFLPLTPFEIAVLNVVRQAQLTLNRNFTLAPMNFGSPIIIVFNFQPLQLPTGLSVFPAEL